MIQMGQSMSTSTSLIADNHRISPIRLCWRRLWPCLDFFRRSAFADIPVVDPFWQQLPIDLWKAEILTTFWTCGQKSPFIRTIFRLGRASVYCFKVFDCMHVSIFASLFSSQPMSLVNLSGSVSSISSFIIEHWLQPLPLCIIACANNPENAYRKSI